MALGFAHMLVAYADNSYGLGNSEITLSESGVNEIEEEIAPNPEITFSGSDTVEEELNTRDEAYEIESAIAADDKNGKSAHESDHIIPEIDTEIEESLETEEEEEFVGTSIGLNVENHTQEDIAEYLKKSGVSIYADSVYRQKPNTKSSPYSPGRLSDESLQNTLGVVNLIRYIAGIDYHVALDSHYTELAQATSLVEYLNNELSHDPDRPSGISDDLYKNALEGADHSNLGLGYTSLGDSIINGFMNDSLGPNITTVGHRRWILNPYMGKTGFGHVGRYYTLYAFDESNWSEDSYESNVNVVWPAQNMPVEFFDYDYPWSISTGKYEDISKIHVTLTRVSDGKTWEFPEQEGTVSFNQVFYVNNDYCGQMGCIIFRPDISKYNPGDEFNVTVTGAVEGTIQYSVSFFELYPLKSFSLDRTSVTMVNGFDDNLRVFVSPAETSNKTVTWTSSNPDVVEIRRVYMNPYSDEDSDTGWGYMVAKSIGSVIITAQIGDFKKTCKVRVLFDDVQNPSNPYYKAIYWAADTGITKGYPDGAFGINRSCTRGEMMMFLWRYAGKPSPKTVSKSPFKDVPKTHTFYKAILWGSQKGITKGYSDGTFGIDRNVSRGECMMFLWRLRGKPAPKTVAKSPFSDVPKNHVFYNAILWGAQQKITTGYTSGAKKGTFGINENCTRGQIVTFLYRAK